MNIQKRILLGLFFLIAVAVLFPGFRVKAEAPAPPEGEWGFLRWGIDWQKFHLTSPRPIDIFVARLHRGETSATIDTAVAGGTIISDGREVPTAMSGRYNGVINYWGQTEPISQTLVPAWGGRNDVAVAINGFYFGDPNEPDGVPWSGVVHSGWYDKRYTERITEGGGFAWTSDRRAFIGSCVYHTGNENNEATFENTSFTPNLDGVNVITRESEEFILFTPQYNSNTGTENGVLELLVEMNSPNQVRPAPGSTGILRSISSKGSTEIPFNHVVLSFWGTKRNSVRQRIDSGAIKVGDEVGIIQQITDCDIVPERDWDGIYAGLGGAYHFMNNGVYTDQGSGDPVVSNSRTAIAFNDDYVYFVVVDGFRPDSIGINIEELYDFLKNNPDIRATDAVTLDSGTSSTMVVNGAVVNNTECNFTRNCGVAVDLLLEKDPSQTILPPETTYKTEWDNPTGILEPLVGSSIMLISSQPISQSLTFTPTQAITTTGSVEVRLGPGTNYASTGTAPAGAHGDVISNLNNLNGVLATGSYWWYVDIGDLAGWVQEQKLQGGSTPPPPPPPIAFTDFIFMPTVSRSAAAFSSADAPSLQDREHR